MVLIRSTHWKGLYDWNGISYYFVLFSKEMVAGGFV